VTPGTGGRSLGLVHLLLPLVLPVGLAGALVGRGLRAALALLPRGIEIGPGWCEAGVGLAGAGTASAVALGLLVPEWAPALAALAVLAVVASATDVVAGRLPNALTLTGSAVLLLTLVPLGAAPLLRGMVGALVLGAVSAGVHLASPAALGAGDVKLAAAVGGPLAAASWAALAWAPVLAALSLALAAATLRRGRLPYGPALLGASCVVVVAIV